MYVRIGVYVMERVEKSLFDDWLTVSVPILRLPGLILFNCLCNPLEILKTDCREIPRRSVVG
jgi:hypothetical protein